MDGYQIINMSKDDQAVSIAISKGLVWGIGSIIVAGVISFCGALFVMYQDVAILKTNTDKFTQQRQVSVKQWQRMREAEDKLEAQIKELDEELHDHVQETTKYMYTFHGVDILGVPHKHKE